MLNKMKWAVAGATLLASTSWAQPASAVNIVVNGGFEQVSGLTSPANPDPITHPEWDLFNTAVGWTDTSNGPGGTLLFGGREGYSEGQRAAIFGSGGGTLGTLSQTQLLSTVIGMEYQLDFDYGAYQGGIPQSLNVQVGGGALLNQTVTDPHASNLPGSRALFGDNVNIEPTEPFLHATFYFFATSTTTALQFSINDSGSSTDMLLDAVSVQAVPEPGSMALMGFGVAAIASRRRKARG